MSARSNSNPIFKDSLLERLAGVLGNFLEHYDNALFGLLAPFIAPLFFEGQDPAMALILTYGMLPLGLITRPLGSLFFGWIGDSFGRRQALFFSLVGMAFVTMGIGFLPIYREIGIWAPISLSIARMLQSFFAAGESSGGAIFILERTVSSKRGLMSSLYDASSIGGILLASALIALVSSQGDIGDQWRILFWAGGITAFIGVFIRGSGGQELDVIIFKNNHRKRWLSVIKEHKSSVIAITFASGFSHLIYSLAFTLMNGYIPLVTSLTKSDVIQVNTILLVLDMFLLPCFGYLANRLGKERVMFAGALLCAIGAIPLFALLNQASLSLVIAVRMTLIVCGVAFSAPYHAWAMELVPPSHRYLILSFGSALGSQLIGAPTAAICLWLYKTLGWSFAPGIYLMLGAVAASFVVFRFARRLVA